MRKILVVAVREYNAAVKSKAFLVSLVVMPLLMFGGIFVQTMTAKMGDVKIKRIAVIDRSTSGELFAALKAKADARNESEIFDKETGKQVRPKIELQPIVPAELSNEQAVSEQRLSLSDRVRKDELFAFIEIGADVLDPKITPTTRAIELQRNAKDMSTLQKVTAADQLIEDRNAVVYATNRPTNSDVREFVQQGLLLPIYSLRMQRHHLPFNEVMPLLTPPKVKTSGLTKRAPDGRIEAASRQNELVATMIPIGLLALMFMVVMVGASPLTVNLVEEKQLRIAEVLLGSLTPFELMMGKLLGGVGTALTLAVVYFIGVFYVAKKWGVTDVISPAVIVWFISFTILATLMYGSMFIAAGSAVTNVKEAQSMLMPVVVLVVLPMFFIESLLRDPSGIVPTIASLFPTSAPMMTVARLAIPPGMPPWQIVAAVLVTLLTTVAVVWAAGRIFRVGILMQGQGARPMEMLKWIFRG